MFQNNKTLTSLLVLSYYTLIFNDVYVLEEMCVQMNKLVNGGWKRALNSLDLELYMFESCLMWVLETEFGSSKRAIHGLTN